MVDIDLILDMFDWNNPKNIQKKGRELARQVKHLEAFLQPYTEKGSKNVWDNCALVLAEKSDEELEPYLGELFEWLQDLNWPGALTIQERLVNYHETDNFKYCFNSCLKEARDLKDEMWEVWLLDLKQKRDEKWKKNDN